MTTNQIIRKIVAGAKLGVIGRIKWHINESGDFFEGLITGIEEEIIAVEEDIDEFFYNNRAAEYVCYIAVAFMAITVIRQVI